MQTAFQLLLRHFDHFFLFGSLSFAASLVVTGATGRTGSLLWAELRRTQGGQVRALVQSVAKAWALLPRESFGGHAKG